MFVESSVARQIGVMRNSLLLRKGVVLLTVMAGVALLAVLLSILHSPLNLQGSSAAFNEVTPDVTSTGAQNSTSAVAVAAPQKAPSAEMQQQKGYIIAEKYRGVGEWDFDTLRALHRDLDGQASNILSAGGNAGLEGHSGQMIEQVRKYFQISRDYQPEVVCEIGVNAGHSAATWLTSYKNSLYYGFDLNAHPYTEPAAELLKRMFPGRATFTWGDSTKVVPEFFEKNHDVKCNILHVDGGHYGNIPSIDLTNMAKGADARNIVIMDDLKCTNRFCEVPTAAWERAKKEGLLKERACFSTGREVRDGINRVTRGVCVGEYINHVSA